MLLIFAFSQDTKTLERTWAGNIDPQIALQILQGLAIADAVQKAAQAAEVKLEEGKEEE